MSASDEETRGRASYTDDEVKTLIAQIADAMRKGAARESTFADKFWERMSSISTFVGSVVLGAVALMFNANYNDQQAKQSEAQFDLEKNKFVNEQEGQRRSALREVIPHLFSVNEAERDGAQALLLEFYPNEAKEILERVSRVHSYKQGQIEKVIEDAAARANETGTWGIVIGHDDSAAAANDEVKHAMKEGFAATVYKKRNSFVTVAVGRIGQEQTGFASEDDAKTANFEISRAIREGTYVVPLKKWCENPQQQQSFVQCSND
jgi:hypothetical protein